MELTRMNERGEQLRQAITALHDRYAGAIFDKCIRMLRDPGEAEDAVQETFVKALRGYDRFTYGDNHLPWLYGIATNVCLQMLRTQRRKGAEPVAEPDQVASEGPKTTDDDPIARLGARRLLELLLDECDERAQQILVAHYLDGMTQGEVAAMLGISRRAVVKRLAAIRKWADQFAGAYDDA